ncbi:hypothetical protein [Brevibacillus choshinensis]|uniref:Uncharacterized protein n=1 Tax=Brevibacillus choshinensis TaxID=54911 RepID=A0ABX7FK04_BRECH|nr:hypothetical protein [Brevibacillus choshinensis]QRG65960.1 hypothetical protein JNE38_20595 [Brevibacillus choshinensis]
MWQIGTLLFGKEEKQLLNREEVGHILKHLTGEQIFNCAWEQYYPGMLSIHTNLNLSTGKIEGGDIFDFNTDMSYLVLLEIDFQSMKPKDILTVDELQMFEREKTNNPLHKWCEKHGINYRNRVKNRFSNWDTISWFWIPEMEETLEKWHKERNRT